MLRRDSSSVVVGYCKYGEKIHNIQSISSNKISFGMTTKGFKISNKKQESDTHCTTRASAKAKPPKL